jgi:hypothetical protein
VHNTRSTLWAVTIHTPQNFRAEVGVAKTTQPTDEVTSSPTGNTERSPTPTATLQQSTSISATVRVDLLGWITSSSGTVNPQDITRTRSYADDSARVSAWPIFIYTSGLPEPGSKIIL